MRLTQLVQLLCGLLMLFGAGRERVLAADRIIGPGQTLALERDLTLAGADSLEIRGTADKPCTLDGRDHKIRTTDKWTGRLSIIHCRIQRLGSKESYSVDRQRLLPDTEAVRLDVYGKG